MSVRKKSVKLRRETVRMIVEDVRKELSEEGTNIGEGYLQAIILLPEGTFIGIDEDVFEEAKKIEEEIQEVGEADDSASGSSDRTLLSETNLGTRVCVKGKDGKCYCWIQIDGHNKPWPVPCSRL